ncbi:MAG TPA: hypothetical protein VIC51_14005 [Psychromonas sp.]
MLARNELQEVVILLSKLITQIALILTSKTDHIFNAFGITTGVRKNKLICFLIKRRINALKIKALVQLKTEQKNS